MFSFLHCCSADSSSATPTLPGGAALVEARPSTAPNRALASADEELRAELRVLRARELKQRALIAGVGEDALDNVLDRCALYASSVPSMRYAWLRWRVGYCSDSPKEAIIELIVQACAATTGTEPAVQARNHPGPSVGLICGAPPCTDMCERVCWAE